MLQMYVQAQLLREDFRRWLNAELLKARREERGMSESVQTALLVVLAISVVALLAAAITGLITRKTAIIAGS